MIPNNDKHIDPPAWAINILHWICRVEIVEDIEGDLLERFKRDVASGKTSLAKRQFIKEVLGLIRPGLIRSLHNNRSNSQLKNNYPGFFKTQQAMFKNIIKTTIRSLIKQRTYTLINTLGLTIGLASFFLILFWVNDEYKVDNFHQNDNRIYQLKRIIYQDDGQNFTTMAVPQPLEIVLEEQYPEVDKVSLVGWEIESVFRANGELFKETGKYVSPEFLEIFSFPLAVGDPETALNEINSVVISKKLAMKLLGEDWKYEALGSTYKLDNETFQVTGVFESIPAHSTLQFDFLIPAEAYISRNNWVENWNNGGFRMIVMMKDDADMEGFGKKVLNEVNNNIQSGDERIVFQKFSDQYLYSNFENGIANGGRIDYVRAILLVAFSIIIIASINFTNLATARSVTRVKEIGVRKVLGAGRNSLAFQFQTEAMVIAFLATILATGIVWLILPYFNILTGKSITVDFENPMVWSLLVGAPLITGVMSGLYPAFFLSSFKPLSAIRGQVVKIGGAAHFRKILVVFQFTISIILIITTIAIFKQIGFIMNKNLGLDRENVVFLTLEGSTRQNYDAFKTELLRLPEITHVTKSNQNPLSVGRSTGGANWDGKDPDFQIEISVLLSDPDFLETLGLDLVAGEDFSGVYHRDSTSIIINQQVAKLMAKANPIGENLSIYGVQGKVIGVVKDFHMTSLHDPIEPLVIMNYQAGSGFAFIKIKDDIPAALAGLERVTKKFNPDYPFSYTFLDVQFEQTYQTEMMVSDLAKSFTLITIFISCLGLFGLSSFMAQQRVKEIGIRKVLGASISNLFILLSINFIKLILLAYVLAIPNLLIG